MPSVSGHSPGSRFERAAATVAALSVVAVRMFLLIRNEPIADPRLFLALRVLLSLGAAILGATIPGFLDIKWSRAGLAVRAGGALALFVLTFVYTPDLVTGPRDAGTTVRQSSSGDASPNIVGKTGNITIQDSRK
jgi:hypothetical protein